MTRAWIATALWLAAAAPATADPSPEQVCHFGAYRLPDGRGLIVESGDGANIRYRTRDGAAGKLYALGEGRYEGGDGWSTRSPVTVRADLGPCGADRFAVRFGAAEAVAATRIRLPVTPLVFQSGDERLYGELVRPAAGRVKAVVVLQYGSGAESAVLNNYLQYMLPLDGVAVFVFDKRGTGRSTGRLSADFPVLARDMAAAVDAVRRQPELRGVPLGLVGESQGGWVAPLAARVRAVDFVVVAYGLAVSPIEEDRAEAEASVARHGPEAIARARALHEAATRVVTSGFTAGLDDLERLKSENRTQPWYAALGGDYTGPLAAVPAEQVGAVKAALDFPISWAYAPEPALAGTRTPTLFVLAARDTEAPHEQTLAVVRRLQAQGAAIDIAVFPDADHGMIAVDKDGRRLGRMADGYFDLLAEWILTRRIGKAYGAATLTPRR